MNIAIMVCGEFRWFDSFEKTFKSNFAPALQGHNVQYFAHFWDQDLEQLSKFTDICNPIITQFEKKPPTEDVKKFFGNTKNLNSSLPNQAYGAHKSFLLLDEYQKQNNTTFDLYIKMRSDLAFVDKINIDNFDNESVYVKDIVHWRPLSNYINDYIYFTKNYNAVRDMAMLGFSLNNILADTDSFIYQKDVSKDIFCPEEILAKHFVIKNVKPKAYSYNIDLARYHP